MFDEYKGIPPEAKLLVYLSFPPGLAVGFIYTDLSYFLPKVQGLLPFWAGVTITTMGVTVAATCIPLGILADRYGRRKMLILGNLCAGISLLGFALTKSLALILLTAVVEGLGEASFAVSFSALLADRAGDEKRTASFSLGALLNWISGAIGAFAISSVVLIQRLGLSIGQAHVVLYVAVALFGLSITPLVLRVHETKRPAAGQHRPILPRKSSKVIARYTVCSLAIALGAGLFVPLMTYWFSAAYGIPDTLSGPLLGVSSILTALAVLLAPRLAKRLGHVKAIVATQASSIFFMVGVPVSPTFAISVSLYTMRVFLMNLSNPLGQSLLMGLVSPEERGTASGVTAALWRLPNSLSTSVGYVLIGDHLLALPFYVATVFYVFSITAFWLMFKDARLPEEVASPAQVLTQSSSRDDSEEMR
jgi:MFS family permease